MGDVIHTLPAVRALKLGYPDTPLTWVVEPKWAPLLEQNPLLGKLYIHDASAALLLLRRVKEAAGGGK